MEDSDQDFSFLCSRLLKRVRRRGGGGGGSGDERKAAVQDEGEDEDSGSQIQSRSKAACKRKRLQGGGVNGPGGGGEQKEQKMRAKDKVLSRMQRFKRATPPRLVHAEEETSPEPAVPPSETGSVPREGQIKIDAPEEKQEHDELVAQRLQRQLDRESESRAAVDVEGGGLFFCQLCYKDLSAMSHQLRTLHINRCLDERERGPAPPPPPPPPPRPRLPECPICGRGFKSEKTRSAHLKRCSASMGVSPAELLQAVQRQTAERQNGQQAGGSRDTSESSMPARKKARRKAPRMDEDTMVALALSRSLLEQEKERERDRQEERRIQEQLSSGASVTVQGRAGAGKTRVRKRKGALDAPPPLLLVQDAQAAQNRIQDRVSALLLIPRPPTPPTPGLLPSELSAHTLLWVKSALSSEASISEFYTAELGEFIQPWVGAESKKSPSIQATPVKQRPAAASESTTTPEQRRAAPPPRCPSTPSLSTPGTQALTDLVDLAEEGLTLTQYRNNNNDPAAAEPPLSGFVPEPKENPGPPINSSVSRLCCDLASMLNNPQLSDVQLQVDSGDVYYAHSFMLYTRCPLLANTVHDAGFGVQEEGFPQAQRVLLNDVSGEAVYALLQYLYTAACDLTPTLLPDVLQLASRFGLSELQQQCEQYTAPVQDPREQKWDTSPATAEPHQSLADNQFLELLRSMWEQEDSDDDEPKREIEGEDEERSRDRENKEDLVDEDELNEIYEFAATQKKMGAEAEVSTESAEELQEEEEGVQDRPDAEQRDEGKQNVEMEEARDVQPGVDVEPNLGSNKGARRSNGTGVSVDRSYNRLFSESWGVYEEPAQTQNCHLERVNTPTTRRMSSVSEVIDLSISPPPDSGEPAGALFPETGVSPGETPDQSKAVQQDRNLEITNAHGASQLPSERSNYWSKPPSTSALSKTQLDVTPSLPSSTKPNLSPPSSQRRQPELIVLSDSSDDDLPDKVASRRDSSRPPTSSPSRLSLRYTQIKSKETTQVGFSPKRSNVTPDSERSRSEQVGCESILDGSAEVSWLIPATPGPSIRSGSTQTSSSIRRTQLFPSSHSSSSSYFSDNPKITSHSNSIKEPHKEHSQPSPALQKLTSHSRLSMTSHGYPVTQTNHNSTAEPCSSTPLHSDPRLQRLDSLGSPLLRDSELRKEGRRPDQGGRLESLHLTLSDKSLSQLQSSQSESSGSLAKSRQYDNPDDQETSAEGKEQEDARTSKTSEGEPMEEDFCFVFDEPPIAFDDSWGLGGAVAEQGPCFSLRLETSEDQNSPPEHGETASPHNFSPPGREAQRNLPDPGTPQDHSLPDAAMWDSWKEDVEEVEDVEDIEEVDALPLSQRVGGVALAKRVSQLRTPVAPKKKNQAPLVPITPMPTFSDMDTPELKNRLNRYGVRPLPKKQMVLKLKEIHQYTHQLMSSGSEDETSPRNRPRAAPAAFKQPTAPPPVSPRKLQFGDDVEEKDEEDVFPASQESNTSSTAESERSNPELCDSDEDGGSDSDGITASQAAVREKDKLKAVRSFILSDPALYSRVLQYQPLYLRELKAGLRTAGIRLGTAKLLDFLDSQCITFTTAKQGHPARSRRRARGAGRGRRKLGMAVE